MTCKNSSVSSKLFLALAMLLLAIPSALSAQSGTLTLARAEVSIPTIRNVEISSTRRDSSCGTTCSIVTLNVSANADWSLQIDAPAEASGFQVRALAPRLIGEPKSAGSVVVRGGRGGDQAVVVQFGDAADPSGLRYRFVQD